MDAFDFTNLAGASDQGEFAKALLAGAEEIEVREGVRMVKDLTVVAKELLRTAGLEGREERLRDENQWCSWEAKIAARADKGQAA